MQYKLYHICAKFPGRSKFPWTIALFRLKFKDVEIEKEKNSFFGAITKKIALTKY